MGRRLRQLAAAFALSVVLALPATVRADVTVSPPATSPGTAVKVAGDGFAAGERVDLFLDADLRADAAADAGGAFGPVAFGVPADTPPGNHVVEGRGATSGIVFARRLVVRTNWGHDAFGARGNAFNRYENVIGPDNVDELEPRCTTTSAVGQPILVDRRLFAVSAGQTRLFAHSATTCARVWSAAIGANAADGPLAPAYAGGLVYVGADRVRAFSARTGAPRWTADAWPAASAPVVKHGRVFVGGADGRLRAFDARTGALRWERGFGAGVKVLQPAVGETTVFVVAPDRGPPRVHALDVATGAVRWTRDVSPDMLIPGHVTELVVAGGRLHHSHYGDFAVARRLADGEALWVRWVGGDGRPQRPVVAEKTVFVGSGADQMSNFRAFDGATGEERWNALSHPGFDFNPTEWSRASVANGVVYAVARGGGPGPPERQRLWALDAGTGAPLWFTDGVELAPPVIADGRLYARRLDQHITAWAPPGAS